MLSTGTESAGQDMKASKWNKYLKAPQNPKRAILSCYQFAPASTNFPQHSIGQCQSKA